MFLRALFLTRAPWNHGVTRDTGNPICEQPLIRVFRSPYEKGCIDNDDRLTLSKIKAMQAPTLSLPWIRDSRVCPGLLYPDNRFHHPTPGCGVHSDPLRGGIFCAD